MNLLEKVWFSLRRPTKLFSEIGLEGLRESLTYYLVLLAFFSAMYSIMTFTLIDLGIVQVPPELTEQPNFHTILTSYCLRLFVVLLLFGGVGIFVYSAWLHLWVVIFKGEESFTETLKSVIYSLTPVLLFGWIPGWIFIIGLILFLWYLILQIFSLAQIHRISVSHAFFAFLVSLVPIFLAFLLISLP